MASAYKNASWAMPFGVASLSSEISPDSACHASISRSRRRRTAVWLERPLVDDDHGPRRLVHRIVVIDFNFVSARRRTRRMASRRTPERIMRNAISVWSPIELSTTRNQSQHQSVICSSESISAWRLPAWRLRTHSVCSSLDSLTRPLAVGTCAYLRRSQWTSGGLCRSSNSPCQQLFRAVGRMNAPARLASVGHAGILVPVPPQSGQSMVSRISIPPPTIPESSSKPSP